MKVWKKDTEKTVRTRFQQKLIFQNQGPVQEYVEKSQSTKNIEAVIQKYIFLLEKAVQVNKEIVQLAGKTTEPYNYISNKDFWFHQKETNYKIVKKMKFFT